MFHKLNAHSESLSRTSSQRRNNKNLDTYCFQERLAMHSITNSTGLHPGTPLANKQQRTWGTADSNAYICRNPASNHAPPKIRKITTRNTSIRTNAVKKRRYRRRSHRHSDLSRALTINRNDLGGLTSSHGRWRSNKSFKAGHLDRWTHFIHFWRYPVDTSPDDCSQRMDVLHLDGCSVLAVRIPCRRCDLNRTVGMFYSLTFIVS